MYHFFSKKGMDKLVVCINGPRKSNGPMITRLHLLWASKLFVKPTFFFLSCHFLNVIRTFSASYSAGHSCDSYRPHFMIMNSKTCTHDKLYWTNLDGNKMDSKKYYNSLKIVLQIFMSPLASPKLCAKFKRASSTYELMRFMLNWPLNSRRGDNNYMTPSWPWWPPSCVVFPSQGPCPLLSSLHLSSLVFWYFD